MKAGPLAILLIGAGFAARLDACPPPPPPPHQEGESDAAYAARMAALQEAQAVRAREMIAGRQAHVWDTSPLVFLARVERVKPVALPFYGPGQSAFIRPVRWIRGQGSSRPFWLRYAGTTDCGPYDGGDAVDGRPGELFVVFARSGRLSSASVIDSVGRANALDPRITDALERDRR